MLTEATSILARRCGWTGTRTYDLKGVGNGKGVCVCVKNNAASVWNRSSKTVRVYFNSGYAGAHQDHPPQGAPRGADLAREALAAARARQRTGPAQ